ncbi:MAG: MraY family glycosyltransferase [Pseudomonadota bacterium]
MAYLLTFFTALVVSMTTIPPMIRLAPRLGMIDNPDSRKVHTQPIPRVGGVGIVVGALIPVMLWVPLDDALRAYLLGSLVLLVFGAWDDSRDLGPYPKFIGQIAAAATVVYYGDVYIASLPFMEAGSLSASVARPFTVFAIVGMINALNVSDGLDGLAGGLSIISLACIAYLGFEADGFGVLSVVVATLGGVLGFLRYNTFPARVFMGDGGSQYLGFTLGFLAVLLTQKINPALSASLPLLFLGLPIVDMLSVIARRLYYGISPFKATKHHIHHRLLELGFDHHEAVVIIYVTQCVLAASAVFLAYESDWLIIAIYAAVCVSLFSFLMAAEARGWRAHATAGSERAASLVEKIKKHRLTTTLPATIVTAAVPVYFMFVSIGVRTVPRDFAVGSALLAAVLFVYLLFGKHRDSIVLQAVNYAASAFMVYLGTKYLMRGNPAIEMTLTWYFGILALAVALTVRYASDARFSTSPMDYLVVLIVLVAGIVLHSQPEKALLGVMAIEAVVLFYACELIVARAKRLWSTQNIVTMLALALLGTRGFIA